MLGARGLPRHPSLRNLTNPSPAAPLHVAPFTQVKNTGEWSGCVERPCFMQHELACLLKALLAEPLPGSP